MDTETATPTEVKKRAPRKKAETAKKPRKAATKKKTAKKSKAQNGNGGGRPSAFSGKKIVKLVKENPRREGSVGFKSFSKIKSGMTYEQYLAAGGRRQDLAFDLAQGYIKLKK